MNKEKVMVDYSVKNYNIKPYNVFSNYGFIPSVSAGGG